MHARITLSLFTLLLSLGPVAFAADEDFLAPLETLPSVQVTARAATSDPHPPPEISARVTAPRIAETINIVDTEDAAKYLPSLFIRKRNYGDTQPTLGTRVWGVSSSARSLVYADGVLLSALVANNNSIGAPRWGLVAPTEIAHVDLLTGPFFAEYPGNSMGAVLNITTRGPTRFEASLHQTGAWQTFQQYGTKGTYATAQTGAAVADRVGKFAVWISGNLLDSHSQPLGYIMAASPPAGTRGGFAVKNKYG
jgi:iron complex outermembrane receptor protein